MPKYLLQVSYTADGAKGLLKDGGSKRAGIRLRLRESPWERSPTPQFSGAAKPPPSPTRCGYEAALSYPDTTALGYFHWKRICEVRGDCGASRLAHLPADTLNQLGVVCDLGITLAVVWIE